MLRDSLILLRVLLWFVTWASQLLWVASKQRAAGIGKVTESAQKVQEAKAILSPMPASPILMDGKRIISELFASIGRISVIVKNWLMTTVFP